MVPVGISKEEKPYFEQVAFLIQTLLPDRAEIENAMEAHAARYRSPEQKTRFLLTVLQLQTPIDASQEDQERLMGAWSSARRLLAGQGAAALRPILAAILRSGGAIPGIEDVLIEAGPVASRVIADVLESPYPPADDLRVTAEIQGRALMVHALGKITDEESRPVLEKVLQVDPHPMVRFAARQALVQMRDQRIVNAVCQHLTSPNEYWFTFSRHLLIEIYGIQLPYRDYGRDATKWLAAFDNAYYKMHSPLEKLLECLDMPLPADPTHSIPASLYARKILTEAAGQDLGPLRKDWEAHFRREDRKIVQILIDALKDENTVNRDAVREGLIRLTGGLNFGTDPDSWRRGLVEMGYLKDEGYPQ